MHSFCLNIRKWCGWNVCWFFLYYRCQGQRHDGSWPRPPGRWTQVPVLWDDWSASLACTISLCKSSCHLPSINSNIKKPTQNEEGNAVSPLFFLVWVEAVQRARSSPCNCLKPHSTRKHVTGLLDRTQCSFLGDMPASVPLSWGVKSSYCAGLKS